MSLGVFSSTASGRLVETQLTCPLMPLGALKTSPCARRCGLVSCGWLIVVPFVAAMVSKADLLEDSKQSCVTKRFCLSHASCSCALIQSLVLRATDAGCDCVNHCVVAICLTPHQVLSGPMKSPIVDLRRSSSAKMEASVVGCRTCSPRSRRQKTQHRRCGELSKPQLMTIQRFDDRAVVQVKAI
jgi:hypothetical protein